MSNIFLKYFGGMMPRYGEQHLDQQNRLSRTGFFSQSGNMPARGETMTNPQATEAENCNLYSGELRPLIKPAKAYEFCRPGEPCYACPSPGDPSDIPVLPPEPPKCLAVEITQAPTSPFVPIGGTANFSVEVNPDASTPIYYQWYRNNELMSGEVASVLSVGVTAENVYDEYAVQVRNPCGIAGAPGVGVNIDVPKECLPWDCAAIKTELAAQGFDTVIPLTRDTAAEYPWPFSTTRPDTWGEPDNFNVWTSYIASPNLNIDWGGYYEIGPMASWNWLASAQEYSECEALVPGQAVNVEANTSVCSTSRPTKYLGTVQGGSSVHMVFTGHEGGSYGKFELCRTSGAIYYATLNDVIQSGAKICPYYVNLRGSSVNAGESEIHISGGSGSGAKGVTIQIGSLEGRWLSFTCSEKGFAEVVQVDPDPTQPPVLRVHVLATISVMGSDGATTGTSIDCWQDYQYNALGVYGFGMTSTTRVYDTPTVLYGVDNTYRLTLASLAVGGDDVIEYGKINTAFLRTFTNYTPPPECNG